MPQAPGQFTFRGRILLSTAERRTKEAYYLLCLLTFCKHLPKDKGRQDAELEKTDGLMQQQSSTAFQAGNILKSIFS